MRKFYATLVILFTLLLLHGCVFVTESLDYRNDLSDYEVKKIVKTVFLSQHALADAALLATDGYTTVTSERYPAERYACQEGGYIRFEIDQNGYALTFETGDLIRLAYDDCIYTTYYDDRSHLSGPIDITWYQDMADSANRLIELDIAYHNTWLKNRYTTLYLNGRIGVHYDEDYSRERLELVLSSDELRIQRSDFSGDDTYENIVLDFSMDTYSYAYRYSYHGTLFNSYLGRLTFTTLSPMRGYRDKNPFDGEFKITNAHMTLRVIPIDDYYVDIVVQNHYDSYENRTIHTTWMNIGL